MGLLGSSGVTMNRSLFLLVLIAAITCGCSYERLENQPERRDSSDSGDRIQPVRDAREDSADSSRVALAYPTGNRSTSAVLVERMSPPEVRLGEAYEYQIKVTNLTNATLSGVIVREKLPTDFAITRAEPQGKVDGDIHAFDVGDLPEGKTKEVTVRVKAAHAGTFTSEAVAHGGGKEVVSDRVAIAVRQPK